MRNLLTIARLAENGADLRNWYAQAWHDLQALPDPVRAAQALAVTSPRVRLTRNCKLARIVLARKMPAGILPNVANSVRRWWQTGQITGRKTGPFARALAGDQSALVLDVWMSRAFNVPQARLFRSDILARIQRMVGRLADRLAWTIAETQAAIWSGTMRQHGRTPRYFPVSLLYPE